MDMCSLFKKKSSAWETQQRFDISEDRGASPGSIRNREQSTKQQTAEYAATTVPEDDHQVK